MTTDLRSALQGIYDQRGELTPALVVDEARDKKHPLHDRFEWNNAVAGEAWRRAQAHELIRSVRVVYREATDTEPQRSVRAFHAVAGPAGHVYEPVERVMADPLLARMVRADMERQWNELRSRFEQYDEFWEIVRRDVA